MIFKSKDARTTARKALAKRLGHQFADERLLDTALTHRSFANEQGMAENYERLEFLGDAVLDLVTAEWLYRRYPEASEGKLTRRKSYLVSEPVLARIAGELELGDLMQLGVGEARSGGGSKASLLADAFESIVGALYLDGGLAAACPFVERALETAEGERLEWRYRDAKSALQEVLQAEGPVLPRYSLTASEGPDHEKSFTVECKVSGTVLGRGEGKSKKLAEQEAAAAALRALDARDD